jgi:hypothetical protein
LKINKKIAASSIAALMAISPVISLAQNPTRTVQAAADSNQKTLLLKHNSYVYGSNGKRLSKYQGSKKLVFTKGATLNYPGGTSVTNAGGKYYFIGRNGYIKAANATPIDNQAQTGTLHLNYNTYVYDKNGKRLKSYKGSKKNTFLRWGHTVKYTATPEAITNDSKQYYYLNDDNYSQNCLPYQTINGSQYYSIGNGGYIKAANVDQIDGKTVYTNEATVTTKALRNYIKSHKNEVPTRSASDYGEGSPYLKVGQKVKVDRVTSMYMGNSADIYYRIKGTTDEFLDSRDITSQPRQPLTIYTKDSYVTFVNDAKAYSINGELQTSKNASQTNYRNGENVPAYKELYIWVPSENKAELFYEISSRTFGYVNYVNYVKASDVKYLSGPRITKPENTPEEAKADAKIASSTDKQALQKLIDQESAVKASGDTYTGTNKEIYLDNLSTYNDILRTAKSVNSSNKSTVAEVKEASWILTKAQQNVINLEKRDNTMAPDLNYLF